MPNEKNVGNTQALLPVRPLQPAWQWNLLWSGASSCGTLAVVICFRELQNGRGLS